MNHQFSLKIVFACISLMASILLLAPQAKADDFPSKPIRLIVGFTPGGGTDIVARIVAQRLSTIWNQPVVVDNRPSSNGTLAFSILAKAPADGYTLAVMTPEQVIAPSLYNNLPYSLLNDLTPVVLMVNLPLILVSGNSFKPNTLSEVISLAKANPGKINFASTGIGGAAHLSIELIMKKAGINMVHIPYKGSAPAYTDLMSGQVDLLSNNIVSTMPLINSGKLKAIAVTSGKPSAIAPDVKSVAESNGLQGYDVNVWFGIVAPIKTPKNIVDKINQEVAKILKEPDVRKQLLAQGAEPVGGSPEDFGKFIRSDMKMWDDVIKSADIKANLAPP